MKSAIPSHFIKRERFHLIQAKGKDDRLDGAAVREQFDHQRNLVSALPQAVVDRPNGGAETLIALVANVVAVFLRRPSPRRRGSPQHANRLRARRFAREPSAPPLRRVRSRRTTPPPLFA